MLLPEIIKEAVKAKILKDTAKGTVASASPAPVVGTKDLENSHR